MVSPKI